MIISYATYSHEPTTDASKPNGYKTKNPKFQTWVVSRPVDQVDISDMLGTIGLVGPACFCGSRTSGLKRACFLGMESDDRGT